MRLLPSGSRGVLLEVAGPVEVVTWRARLEQAALPGVVDLVPAARTVLLVLDPGRTDPASLAAAVRALDPGDDGRAATAAPGGRHGLGGPDESDGSDGRDPEPVTVEVVYDGEDLAAVGELTGWGADGVVARHTATTWTVAFSGFAPGFGYALADDGPTWSVPRRAEPRTRVPAGAVALADGWTGVYPTASPGGWQLVGRTRAAVWDLDRDPPALLRPGVRVRFVAVAG